MGAPLSLRTRLVASAAAVLLAVVPMLVVVPLGLGPWLGGINPSWALGIGAIAGAAAAVIAGVLGWILADRVLRQSAPGRSFVVLTALLAVVAGAALVGGFLGVGTDTRVEPGGLAVEPLARSLAYGFSAVVMWSGIAMLYGLFLLGIPALVVAAVLVWLWIRVVRRFVRERVGVTTQPINPTPREALPFPTDRKLVGWVAVLGAAVLAGAEAGMRAASNDPPGILHGALFAWLLTFVGPALVAAAGLRARSVMLVRIGVVALVVVGMFATLIGTIGFAVAGVVLAWVAGSGRARLRLAGAPALLIVLLLISAPAAMVATTERVCWDVYAEWGLTMRIFPDEPNGPSEVPILSSGCEEDSFSGVGAALATYASLGAFALTFIVARRTTPAVAHRIHAELRRASIADASSRLPALMADRTGGQKWSRVHPTGPKYPLPRIRTTVPSGDASRS
jgi:hypothetical protein